MGHVDPLQSSIRVTGAGMVMLIGVQSNQFPRALDLAKVLRERDRSYRDRASPRGFGGSQRGNALFLLTWFKGSIDSERAQAFRIKI
jgi:hypothetical protein